MQATVTVSDELVREAAARGIPLADYVEMLIDKGVQAMRGRPELENAMARIRALRSSAESRSL
jgi:post-segregation antitoxin (ccd killing protein)